MVTCAKLQQSCQSSLYRELSELIREKAFCQPSACKSQSLPNLPLFNIFDHFDSLFSLLLFLRARRRFYRLWSFCFIIGPACRRVDFIFDSSTGYNCARLLALPHLKKRKKRRYFFASCWFSSRLYAGTSCSSQVSLKAARFSASEHRCTREVIRPSLSVSSSAVFIFHFSLMGLLDGWRQVPLDLASKSKAAIRLVFASVLTTCQVTLFQSRNRLLFDIGAQLSTDNQTLADRIDLELFILPS